MAKETSYQGLARKWRPRRFEDLVGQEAVAEGLMNALRAGRAAHGHLLTGPRGVGKTSAARILAMALNCEKGPTPTPCGKCRHCLEIAAGTDLDVIEIDAASNTKVEQMRELLERVIHAPFNARHKVYIIDEVHMLSNAAFNALLKTLEEPPPFVTFVLATTEVEKVPETIRSRCVVHNFRRLTAEDIVRRLNQVSEGEKLKLDKSAASEVFALIARSVEGGMRDALVIFDQLIALGEGKPTVEAASRLLGLADQSTLGSSFRWLAAGEAPKLLELIEELVNRGRNLERFVKSLVAYGRDLMLLQAGADSKLVGLTGEALEEGLGLAHEIAAARLFNIIHQLFDLESRIRTAGQARFLIEFTFLRIASIKPVIPIDEIMERIQALPEQSFSAGAQAGRPARREAAAGASSAHRFAAGEGAAPRAAAIMNDWEADSAPPGEIASSPAIATGSLAGLDKETLSERIVPNLPDAARFLGRYLRQARDLRVEGAVLRVEWDAATGMARRMLEKAEHVKIIEQTLSRLSESPLKVVHADAGSAAAGSVPSHGRPANRSAIPSPAPVLADDAADAWATDAEPPLPEAEPIDEAYHGDFAELTTDDMVIPIAMRPPHEEQSAAAPPADRRGAAEKTRAFLNANSDAARRVKLLRDMFGGNLIDDAGRTLSI